MCDDCRELERDLAQSGLPDAINRARRRLECYYKCVTSEGDIFEEELEDEQDDNSNFWEPEY